MTTLSFRLYSGETPPGSGGDEETSGEVLMDNESDNVGGYAVPMDPMDLLQCESCQ
jgi:hypothetical protein